MCPGKCTQHKSAETYIQIILCYERAHGAPRAVCVSAINRFVHAYSIIFAADIRDNFMKRRKNLRSGRGDDVKENPEKRQALSAFKFRANWNDEKAGMAHGNAIESAFQMSDDRNVHMFLCQRA